LGRQTARADSPQQKTSREWHEEKIREIRVATSCHSWQKPVGGIWRRVLWDWRWPDGELVLAQTVGAAKVQVRF
jgi:hypothetical protein